MLNKLFVFGDSIVYGKWDKTGGWVSRLRRYIDTKFNLSGKNNIQVYNLGIPGELLIQLPKRLRDELSARLVDPKDEVLVITASGLNDSCFNNWRLGKQSSEKDFKRAIHDSIAVCNVFKTNMLFVGLTPVDSQKAKSCLGLNIQNDEVIKFDNYLSQITQITNVYKLETYDVLEGKNYKSTLIDGIHPNTKGHQMIAEIVIDYIATQHGI